jgi:hypothetical protein
MQRHFVQISRRRACPKVRPRCAGPAGMLLAEMAWAGVKVAAELSVTIAVGSGW